jgi:hypothetical protein
MKRFRLLVVGALAVAALGLGAPPASACQPDSPCPCSEEPTRTINNTWNRLTGRELIQCTF